MTNLKYWWFETNESHVYVFCSNSSSASAGKRLCHNNGKVYSAVKKLSAYPANSPDQPSTSTEEETSNIKVVFYTDKPRVLSRGQFLWNVNEFCRNLKPDPESLSQTLDFIDLFEVEMETEHGNSTGDILNVSPEEEQVPEQSPSESQTGSLKSRKRQMSDVYVTPLFKKRLSSQSSGEQPEVSEIDALRDEVDKAFLGHVRISLENLGIGQQIRPVKEEFVRHLQEQMGKFSNTAYQPLIAVTTTLTSKEAFSESGANGYKYDVIGGQHNLLATRGMSEKKPTNSLFHSRWCAIYYGGMSSDAVKYLANQHNTIGDCRHEMTFKEKVHLCRKIREEHTEMADTTWKRRCAAILHEEDLKSQFLRTLTFLAASEPEVFALIDQVMSMFQAGELKGQSLRKKEILTGVPQIRIYVFRSYRTLPASAFERMLQDLVNRKITLGDFKREGEELLKLQGIQRAVMDLTHSESWEHAQERFPEHTDRKVLFQFINLKFKSLKGVPPELREFCQMLLKVEARQDQSFSEIVHKGKRNTSGFHINGTVDDAGYNMLVELDSSFPGFHLGILDMPMEWEEARLEAFVANFTSTNVSAKLTGYTLVILCQVPQQPLVNRILTNCQQFSFVANCFYHIKGLKSDEPVTDTVFGMVIAKHQPDSKKMKWELNSASSGSLIICDGDAKYRGEDGSVADPLQKPLDLYREIILSCSSPQQWVLDACCGTGTGLIAALKEARNCVAVEEDSAKLFHLPARFNQLVPSAVGRKNDESSPAPGPTDVYDYESDSSQTLQSDSSN